jgi:hypothetical protein
MQMSLMLIYPQASIENGNQMVIPRSNGSELMDGWMNSSLHLLIY